MGAVCFACVASNRRSFLWVCYKCQQPEISPGVYGAYMNVLDIHLPIPQSRKFVKNLSGLFIFNRSTDRIISAREIPLGLELDVGHEVILGTTHITVIAQLIFHLPKKNATRIHIGLGNDANLVSSCISWLVSQTDILFLALFFILTTVHESQSSDTLHHTGGGIAQEFTARFECSIDANAMIRSGKEIARLRGVMGGLFRYVVAASSISVVPVAGESFSEDRVERLFHSSVLPSIFAPRCTKCAHIRRFDVPSTQVEFDHRYEALDGIVNRGHREKSFRVGHKASIGHSS